MDKETNKVWAKHQQQLDFYTKEHDVNVKKASDKMKVKYQ